MQVLPHGGLRGLGPMPLFGLKFLPPRILSKIFSSVAQALPSKGGIFFFFFPGVCSISPPPRQNFFFL